MFELLDFGRSCASCARDISASVHVVAPAHPAPATLVRPCTSSLLRILRPRLRAPGLTSGIKAARGWRDDRWRWAHDAGQFRFESAFDC